MEGIGSFWLRNQNVAESVLIEQILNINSGLVQLYLNMIDSAFGSNQRDSKQIELGRLVVLVTMLILVAWWFFGARRGAHDVG